MLTEVALDQTQARRRSIERRVSEDQARRNYDKIKLKKLTLANENTIIPGEHGAYIEELTTPQDSNLIALTVAHKP